MSELLSALPGISTMAYVLVQHLDPAHESLLSEILAKKTVMPVVQIHHEQKVEPGHVYVIPPNTTLTLLHGHFHLARRNGSGPHLPIDILFRSLADVRAHTAIGVVLSGGNSDGALGIQAIKQGGGITFAQEPESARSPSMPQSAIETGCVDFILRPEQIARELMRLESDPYVRVIDALAPANDAVGGEGAANEEDMKRVMRLLRAAHGVDFSLYKRGTLRRRLARRMALRGLGTVAEYLLALESDPGEVSALYQDFLIRVTSFFRDPESFQGLRVHGFPQICEGRTPKEPVRIWVPGCASGEEVYSVAIALVEFLGERASPAAVQIFGTDVSEVAIETARAGLFPIEVVQDVSNERLERFFVKQGSHYAIAKSIRDLCVFAPHDVTRDPPFSRLDLISCRNVLIYLDTNAQRRVMDIFHYALRPSGFLMLGPSESVGSTSDLFSVVGPQQRLYARKALSPGNGFALPLQALSVSGASREAATNDNPRTIADEVVPREADRLLLARYAPASILVDEELNILQFRGETGPFMEHASGPPSLNLHRVALPELLIEITPAINEARVTGHEVRRAGLRVRDLQDVSIDVIPLRRSTAERCYLILFEDGAHRRSGRAGQLATMARMSESEKDIRLAQLEREAAATRDYLQAIVEEHEAGKERLKCAHEEVLSANEEFQSTNEELETAKEELQSANEELTTTNDELASRNRELSSLNAKLQKAQEVSEHAREYADVIVESVREPLLVLDGELKVLRANNAFYVNFKAVREHTEGCDFYSIGAARWNIPALRERLRAVLTRDETMVEYEVTQSFPSLGERIISLNARKLRGGAERAELILLAMEDVTERRAATRMLREDARRKDEFLAMLAHELRSPLAAITQAIQLLRRMDIDAQSAKLHEIVERQTMKLRRLVDDLLDLARITRGRIALTRELVDMGVVARHAGEASRVRLDERQHVLTLVLPTRAVMVEGDPIRLEQAVSNVLENAARYTPPGGRIRLTLTEDNGEAVLSISDNGIGLAAESLQTIFGLFTQVHSPLARSAGGLGIGLNLVQRLLELHGGRIEARSDGLGHGSVFIIRLPVSARQIEDTSSIRDVNVPDAVAPTPARRVLVVDDNADAAESMALLARDWGHEAAMAGDGGAALLLATSFLPETALVDIGLPGMDGYELARQLRATPGGRELYLIAMTGYGRDKDRRAAFAAGFDAHIVKPANMDELQKLLSTARSQA